VTLRARWVTLRAHWVTLRARWVTLRARWVVLRAFVLGGAQHYLPIMLRLCLHGQAAGTGKERDLQEELVRPCTLESRSAFDSAKVLEWLDC
jgi:hypothetical protein